MANGGERRRTMVYSNVNKKAEMKSAFQRNDVIDLDDEVVIGLTKNDNSKNSKNNKIKKNKNKVNGKKSGTGNDELKALWESEKEEIKREEQLEKKKGKKSFIKKLKKLQKKNEMLNKNEPEFLQEKKDGQATVNKKQLEKVQKQIKQNHQSAQKTTGQQSKQQYQSKQQSKQQAQTKSLTIQERIKKQKRRIIAKLSFVAILIIMLIGGFVYFLLSPVFNIKNIKVTNNANIATEEIIKASNIKINENMFKFSKREAKKAILKNPYIEEVKIKRKPFNNVEIIVKERVATLMLEYGNSYVYINNQGYILEISTEKLDVPMLTGYVTPLDQVKPGNRLSKEDLERLSVVLNIMQAAKVEELDYLISKIDIKNKREITLTFETEGKTAHLGACTNLSYQMQFIRQFIDREKGIEGDIFVDMDLNKKNPVFREKV